MPILKQLIQPLAISFTRFTVTASGLATALFLFRYSDNFTFNAFFFSLVGFTFHSPPFFKNVNPRYLLLVGLTTFVFVAFTFRNSFLSNQSDIDFITLFADISLLVNINTSSAYLVKRSPLCSSSLSNLSRYILERITESGPPCGTPVFVAFSSPFSITPARRYLRIRFKVVLSFTCSLSI